MGTDPLSDWRRAGPEQRSRLLTEDVRRLLRDLAEARFAAADDARRRDEARSALLVKMLEVLDGFDRVFGHVAGRPDEVTGQMKVWLGNFRAVRRLLERALKDEGVARMECVSSDFDPRWHTVADTVADPARPEGTIASETRAGYFLGRDVLRKAEVVVVKQAE